MERSPKSSKYEALTMLFVIINIGFLLIYIVNIIDLIQGKYTPDGIRFSFYTLLLEVPMVLIFILAIVYKLRFRFLLLVLIAGFTHLLSIGIVGRLIPVYGFSVALMQIVIAIILFLKKGS